MEGHRGKKLGGRREYVGTSSFFGALLRCHFAPGRHARARYSMGLKQWYVERTTLYQVSWTNSFKETDGTVGVETRTNHFYRPPTAADLQVVLTRLFSIPVFAAQTLTWRASSGKTEPSELLHLLPVWRICEVRSFGFHHFTARQGGRTSCAWERAANSELERPPAPNAW